MPDRPFPPLEAFPIRASSDIRYADLDRQGHVNNAVFATYCEIGRVAFLYRSDKPLAPEGATFVIARLEIDFLSELYWPGSVDIGTGVSRIGRSSFGITQGVFSQGRLAAAAQGVLVMMDARTRRSMPLPEMTIAALNELVLVSRP
jgi:acyl-CoA thioester hydrolase